MPDAGLDTEKLTLLARWAEGLQADQRPEVAASGKAILMLIEEIERLHVVVWDGRLNPPPKPEPEPAQDGVEDFPSLLQRLRHRLSADSAG